MCSIYFSKLEKYFRISTATEVDVSSFNREFLMGCISRGSFRVSLEVMTPAFSQHHRNRLFLRNGTAATIAKDAKSENKESLSMRLHGERT